MVLDAIEESVKITKRNHRHSIIHAQLANLEQVERMKKLGVGAQTQPIFLNSDIPIIESRLGERSEETYLFNTMHQMGITATISTDCPVEGLNPFHNLYCAITRKSIKHDTLPPHLVGESFSLKDALICYTKVPYYFSYEDYIVLNKKMTEENLLELEVKEVYMDSKKVF